MRFGPGHVSFEQSISQRLKKSKKFAFRNSPFTIQNNGLSSLFVRKFTCIVDAVIVSVKKDSTSRAYCKLAKVDELITGADGRVRAAATVNVSRDSKKPIRLRRVIQHFSSYRGAIRAGTS